MDNYALIVDTVITRNFTSLLKVAYNIACLFSTATPVTGYTTNKTKLYTDATSVAKDWGADSEPAKKATAYFSQNPKSNSLRISKRTTPVATIKTITVSTTLTTGAKINGNVNGVALTETAFDTSHSATMTALAAKIALVAGVASATVSTNVITVTASVNYSLDLNSFEVSGVTPEVTIAIATTTAGNSIANDIDTAILEVDDWYEILLDSTNAGDILSTAKKTESLSKIATLLSSDANIYNSGSTSDVAYQTNLRGYNRTNINYHQAPSEGFDAAITSRCLGVDPGKGIRANRTVTGPTASVALDDDKIAVIKSKKANCYPRIGGSGSYYFGTMASGLSIEIIRDTDYTQSEITLAIFNLLKTTEKLGYDADGITQLVAKLEEVLKRLVKEGVILDTYTITPPVLSEISDSDKSDHIMPNVRFTAEIKKGIKKVLIRGSMT